MAGINARCWWAFAALLVNVLRIEGQEIAVSAVLETDQDVDVHSSSETVGNWVYSGRPGLFMHNFNLTGNTTFIIPSDGVYYVTANLLVDTKSSTHHHHYYSNTVTLQGVIYLQGHQGAYLGYNKRVTTYTTMGENEQRNLRISAYMRLEADWELKIKLLGGYGWNRIIKSGSTLSIMYVSKASMFPGVLLRNNYEYVYLVSPNYSEDVTDWGEITEGGVLRSLEGNIMVPHSGLYHVLLNLNARRYSQNTNLKFSIVINNKTEAISKTTAIDWSGTDTITLEGVLNLVKSETISVTISSPSLEYSSIYVQSSSTFFMFSKGQLGHSVPAVSTSYISSSNILAADTWSNLNQWDVSSKAASLDHYSNVQLQNGEFVSPKAGIYQVTMTFYLSNCTKASARLSLKTPSSGYQTATPDMSFTQEPNDCYLQDSILLEMQENDTLKVEVKSNIDYTVLTKTTYQVLLQTRYALWPAAIFYLPKAYTFKTNTGAVKITGWSHISEGNWNDAFFNTAKDSIEIKTPGLYLVSYNLVVKVLSSSLQAQFQSHVILDDKRRAEGSLCERSKTPALFTCTTSTLLNMNEKSTLALQVQMTDASKKEQSAQILATTRATLTFIGDTRSHASFKLSTQPSATAYTTKAKATDMKSFSDFTFPNNSFFQSAATYSKLAKAFTTGSNNGFFLFNNAHFNLQNDGAAASIVGSADSSMTVYSKEHKKGHFSVSASDLSYNSQFYFNVSAKATGSELKWQPEKGSVVSGVYVGNHESTMSMKALLRTNAKVQCSSHWTQINAWKLIHNSNLAQITRSGVQVMKDGFYVSSLNLAVTSNSSNTVIDVGIFADDEMKLFASETSPDGTFSIFLQGVLELKNSQKIDIKIKCGAPSEITYVKGGGIFAFKVDEYQLLPGLRMRFYHHYYYYYGRGGVRKLTSYYYSSGQSAEEYSQDLVYTYSKITVPRDGVYLVAVVGYAETSDSCELAFTNQENISDSTCSINTLPLYFKDSSEQKKPLAMTAFLSLKKNEVFSLIARLSNHYHWSYNSRYYMSVQFMRDASTSNGITATLEKNTTFKSGQNQQFTGKAWISGKSCGKFSTRGVPAQFGKHKILYTGYYVVSTNFVLQHQDGCVFKHCFAVNGKILSSPAGTTAMKPGCFEQTLQSNNGSRTSTVSGTELLYLEAGNDVSLQLGTTQTITITSRSSFSLFYLGTSGAVFGLNSVILKAKQRELPTRYYSYNDQDKVSYTIEGWTTDVPSTKLFFKNGVKTDVKEMFVSPRDGVYMVMAKLHVNSKETMKKSDCEVKLELAVDGERLDFAFEKDFEGSVNTLSFMTTLRLEKWQGVQVRFTRKRLECGELNIGAGSSFAVVYLAKGSKAFTLWPNIGPHIVDFPESSVYVREDLSQTHLVICKAVGEHPITYQWKTYSRVVSEDSVLDTRKMNTSLFVQCVATMGELVAESRFVTIQVFDPTIVFSDTYNNRTYNVPERNSTSHDRYKDVLFFGARFNKSDGHYHWWNRISCNITQGNVEDTFMIEEEYDYWSYRDDENFKLRVKTWVLDREKQNQYLLEITCRNLEYTDAKPAVTTIQVDILDVNDNLPVFEKEIYNTTVSRNLRPGQDIIQVRANDDDVNVRGITYSLEYTSDSYIFVIDKKFGIISLAQREKLLKPYYRLTAEATDDGKPPRSTYVTVVIEVKNFNPNKNYTNKAPVFVEKHSNAYLIRGTLPGTKVTTVHAHDPIAFPPRRIRYYFLDGNTQPFTIDSKTGQIKTKIKMRKPARYILLVAAEYVTQDEQEGSGPYYNTTEVDVVVIDIDIDKPTFEHPFYEVSIPENAKINSEVLKVRAVYQRKLKYSIPTDRGMFKMDPSSGLMTLAAELDFETLKEYTFVVSAKDPRNEANAACTDVTVHVTDVNDNAPVIYDYPKTTIHVTQGSGSQKIGHIFARDKDNDTNSVIKYYLEDDFGQSFILDENTGVLNVNGNLSCCDVVYALTVEAKDQGTPPLSDTVRIDVVVVPATPGYHAHTGSHTKMRYILIGVIGGVVLLVLIAGVLYWRRRRRRSNYESATMNYMNLPSDEEDDELLNAGDESNHENEGRLSLISAASDENLLRNEEPC